MTRLIVALVRLVAVTLAFLVVMAAAAPMPSPVQRRNGDLPSAGRRAMATPGPRQRSQTPTSDATANDILEFYRPDEQLMHPRARVEPGRAIRAGDGRDEPSDLAHRDGSGGPTPTKRGDQPTVPLSQLGPPSFPAEIPSCYNCQQKYSSLSSCMEASAVFENSTNIFNSPLSYIAVIKCACTDTFQAVYPQCVQCFQMTNQCQYLGTDPEGTGAPEIVTNMRSICAFGSSILGGAESANYPDYNNTFTPSTVPPYYDVTQTGPGYEDQATGAIFGAAAPLASAPAVLPLVAMVLATVVALLTAL